VTPLRRLAWLVVAVSCGLLAWAPGAHAAAQPAKSRVVIIAVPNLLWSDLAVMPRLSAYAEGSSVGDLTVRAEPDATRCADGSLTFAAGNRADAGGATGCTIDPSSFGSLRATLRHDRYGGDIAAFGDALRAANVTTAAVGPGADLLLADAAGQVDLTTSDLQTALSRSEVVAVVDDALYVAPPADLAATAARLDNQLSAQLAQVPPGATTIVAGTSDGPIGGPQLHVVLVHGPGWRHAELSSPSTHSAFVQLVDLAPTVLATLHLAVPTSMIGHPVFDSSRPGQSLSSYVDANRHELASRRVDGTIRTVFGIAGMLVLVLVVAAWRSGNRHIHDAAMWLSRLAVGLPIATYLLELVPWWRASIGLYPVMVVAVMAVLAAVMSVVLKSNLSAGVIVVPAVTAVVLLVDQLAGAPLQRSAPLGYLVLVAARFHGMGNIAFACLCASALICAGVVGGQLRERGHARAALLAALVICILAVVVDAAPRWGDDFGGVLAMPPCAVLLLALLAEIRVTAKRVALAVAAVLLVAVALSAADYARPADQRTQIGTFAGEVLHGGAGRTIRRKLYSDLHSFGNVAVTGSVVLLLILVIVCRAQVGAVLRRVPGLRAAAISVALLAVIGTADNDSGVVIAQFALLIGLLAVVGSGLADPASAVAGGRPPLPSPGRRLRPPTGSEPLPS
jgi:hypothetical protein